MEIIPAIDIRGGKCVRLYQGDYNCETVYNDNPIVVAEEWEKQGAQMLHIVDLDGAKKGRPINTDTIAQLVKTVKIPIQVGGGIRSMDSIDELIKLGVSRIILGTSALDNSSLLVEAISSYGEKVIISLDVKNGVLMKNGWLEKSNSELFSTLQELETKGVSSIIYTDTIKDGTLTEPNYSAITLLRSKTPMNLIIAGGVSSIEQIKQLKDRRVNGVILGKALYEGKITIKEANTLC